MTYYRSLLRQPVPLEPHEQDDLRAWLATLESDCAVFGETAEDASLMNTIRAKIDASSDKSGAVVIRATGERV